MGALFNILVATLGISLIAFIGILTLFLKKKFLNKILLILVALSAGALIGGAFLHLLPKSIQKTGNLLTLFLYLIGGFVLFFILEQFIRWHHCGGKSEEEERKRGHQSGKKPFSYLILFSDTLHNFIDGLVIAASFLVGPAVGLVTTLAIALHEIRQGIGDFGVLVYGVFGKRHALLFNFLTCLTAVIGGLVGFMLAGQIGNAIIYLLPFAAGNFIYIAASDLIPEIKHEDSPTDSLINFVVFLVGIGLMLLVKIL